MKWGLFIILIYYIARLNYKQAVHEYHVEGYENWSAYPNDRLMFSLQVQPTETVLNGITLYEQIDLNELNALKNTDYVKYGNEKTDLTKYAENYNKRMNLFAVSYSRGKRKFGRVYPVKLLGMTSFRRITRNTLMRNNYYYIDIDNSAPRILRDILKNTLPAGKKIELEYPQLDEFCNNRDQVISDIMRAYNCSCHRAKKAIMGLMSGGSVASWKYGSDAHNIVGTDDPVVESFLNKFQAEIQSIITLFIDNNKELYENACETYRKRPENKDKNNERGSFFLNVRHDYEIKVIDRLMKYIMEKKVFTQVETGHHIATYCYDGFMLLKDRVDTNGGIDALIADLEQKTFDYFGVNLNFSARNMHDEYHTEFSYQPSVEGYENWSACVEQGYPKDWCMFTPDPMQPAPGYCNCGGGHYGSYHVDGKCNCYLYNPQLLPMYVEKQFHDFLA